MQRKPCETKAELDSREPYHRRCMVGKGDPPLTVTPDYVFRVGDSLRDEFKNGRSYYILDGRKIAVPERELWRPNRELLEWHQREVFRS